MGVGTSIGKLYQTIDRYESDGGSIRQVDATIRNGGDEPCVSVDVAVPLCSSATDRSDAETAPQAAALEDDGGLRLEFPPSVIPSIGEHTPDGVSTSREAASVTSTGTVLVTFTLGFEEDAELNASEGITSGSHESGTGVDATVTYSEQTHVDRDPAAASGKKAEPGNGLSSIPTNEAESTAAADPDQESTLDSPVESASEIERELNDTETKRALEAARNEDLPPYDDIEYLQCLYDSFDTFTAMSDALEMDVASETVRRYMIDAGIHEPASYNTTAAGEDEAEATDDSSIDEVSDQSSDDAQKVGLKETSSGTGHSTEIDGSIESVAEKQLVADGIGLPENVEIDELLDAIESAMTLYDVQRALKLERDRTRELLEQLNLMDLVSKRVYDSVEPERRPSRNEIADRIRESITPE